MNDSAKMTLASAIGLVGGIMERHPTGILVRDAWEFIKVHLAPRDVSVTNEDVERACIAYHGEVQWECASDGVKAGVRLDIRAALQSFAASLPVAKVCDRKLSESEFMALSRTHEDVLEIARKVGIVSGSMDDPIVTFNRATLKQFESELAKAYLLAQGHVGVREGWKLVPSKLTNAMEKAERLEFCRYLSDEPQGIRSQGEFRLDASRSAYKAMLAAAPAYDDGGNGNG